MKRILLFTIAFCASIAIHAQFNEWTGAGDGAYWDDELNWSGGIPTEGDDVIINIGDSSQLIVINEPIPTLGSLQLLNYAYIYITK